MLSTNMLEGFVIQNVATALSVSFPFVPLSGIVMAVKKDIVGELLNPLFENNERILTWWSGSNTNIPDEFVSGFNALSKAKKCENMYLTTDDD